jgi:hypothetical protein
MKHLAAAALIAAGAAAWTSTHHPHDRQSSPLEAFEGQWQARVKAWAGPGGTPSETTLAVERREVQGLLQTFPSDSSRRDALPFHALHYNAVAARYESVFSNPAHPALVLLTGQADGSGKTIILTGSTDTGEGGRVRWKEVHTVVNETTTRAEFFQTPPGGQEWMVIEITFSRASRRDDPMRRPEPGAPRPISPPTHPSPRPPGSPPGGG